MKDLRDLKDLTLHVLSRRSKRWQLRRKRPCVRRLTAPYPARLASWLSSWRARRKVFTPNTVELIPTLGALPPRGGPVQDPVLTEGAAPLPSEE